MGKLVQRLTLIPILASLAALFLPILNSAEAFSDVKEGGRYFVPITSLSEAGIIQGYEDGTFKPYDKINRAEALSIILKAINPNILLEAPTPEAYGDPFNDVSEKDWFAKYVIAAKEKWIIAGQEDGNFHPEMNMNLAEALKIIEESIPDYTTPEVTDDPFADTPKDAWFAKYMQYAKDHEMINISIENKVLPDQEMTRGYLSEIIYKLNKFNEESHFGKATYYGAAVQGHGTASGKTFDMYALTAAHKTLPFGTIVEVTNLANGKKIQVEITDRGPYGYGRIIDLTSEAFSRIADLSAGIINVECRIISTPN